MTENALFGLPRLKGPGALVCIGAHSDDIEIGCGATVARVVSEHPGIDVVWVVLAATDPDRRAEAESSARRIAGDGVRTHLKGFRERYLPYEPEVKEFFDELARSVQPRLVLTPSTSDRHQDHRLAAELTWNTFRDSAIWEYEIPKYEGDLGNPNLFVPLTEEEMNWKVAHLTEFFGTQAHRYWFSEENFRSLARLRGIECRSESGYAEAFHAKKVVVA